MAATHLHDGRVTGEPVLRFGWLGHGDVLDVAPSEDDVLVGFFFGRHGSVRVTVFCPVGFNCRKKPSCRLFNRGKETASLHPPLAKAMVDLSVSTDDRIPSYRICALEIRLILLPMYGVPPLMFAAQTSRFQTEKATLPPKNWRNRQRAQSRGTCALYRTVTIT